MKYGIEFEFFVSKDSKIVPAYLATNNLDGNPVVGELKTLIHNNIIDCVFELEKLIYIEATELNKKGFIMCLKDSIILDNETLINLRKDKAYINRKELESLEEFSIYLNKKTGKLLPRNLFKASLQVNISNNKDFGYSIFNKVTVEDKYKYVEEGKRHSYSSIFNYPEIINKLDIEFKDEILNSNRVKGVYAIKPGSLGDRIEYRSLPNTINLKKLIKVLS